MYIPAYWWNWHQVFYFFFTEMTDELRTPIWFACKTQNSLIAWKKNMLSLVVWHKWLFSNPKLFMITFLMPLGYLLISTYLPIRFDALCTRFPFWKHWALRNHQVHCWSGIHFERQHNFLGLVSHFKYEKWKLYNELEKGCTFMKLKVIFSSWKWH